MENICSFSTAGPSVEKNNKISEMVSKNSNSIREESEKKDENYGPWMIMERKLRRKVRDNG